LILTLWMVTVLSLIAYSLAYEMRLEVRLTKLKKENFIAFQLARAGISKAICDLKNDMVIDRSEDAQVFDAEGDVWVFPEDKINIEMGDGTYTVKIIDEESYLNLNTMNVSVLRELIKYFIGEDEDEEAEKIAFAILDWKDPGDIPASGEAPTETEAYQKLIEEDFGLDYDSDEEILYRLKNDFFTSVEELLDVYGMTPELFYGFDPEERKAELFKERAEREEDNIHVMDITKDDLESWYNREPEGLRDCLTINSSGALNVNTAGEAVLTALIAASGVAGNDPGDLAQAIIDYRRGGSDYDIDNDNAFRNIGELSQVDGLSGPVISRIRSLQRLTTTSTNFRIISVGKYKSARRTIEVVVSRTWESFNVDTTDDDYNPDVRRRIRRKDEDDDDERITVDCPTVRILQWRER